MVLGDVAEPVAELLDAADVENAGQREAQHLAATDGPQHVRRGLHLAVAREDGRGLVAERHERARSQLVEVFEPRDRLRAALKEFTDEAGPGEHPGEAQRGVGRVAEQSQVPVRRAERVGEPSEGEHAVIGVGALGEPGDEHGHEVPLDRRPSGDPGGEGRDVPERALRITEADRGEPSLRLRARELEPAGRERRHGGEQRPVEEPLVQAAHPLPRRLPERGQLGRVAGEPARSREDAKLGLVARHEVGPAQARQLQAVLQHAEQAIVVRELAGLLAADVAAARERAERGQGAALVDLVVARAVHELQQLHGELDVAESTGTELQLHIDLVGGDVLGDPLAHLLHRLDEAVACGARPDHRRERREVPGAELGVAGERPGLQQGLELPALRPPLVVLHVRVEGAHERPVLALRAEVRVDLPERRLDPGVVDEPARHDREPGRDLDRAPLGEALLVGGLRDEDHVDVAQVVELARPGLAHADDREAGRRDLIGRVPPRGSRLVRASPDQPARRDEGGVERGAGEVGEACRHRVDGLDRTRPAQVVDGDAREQAAVAEADRPGCLFRLHRTVAELIEGADEDRARLVLAERRLGLALEQHELVGVPQQELAEPS